VSGEKEFDYMNVIPLVDVMLVMLTIVLTTSTFIATGNIPVELPRAAKTNVEALKTEVVEITRAGNLFLNGKPVTPDSLKVALNSRERSTAILIRADRNINLQAFVDVLDTVKSMGFKTVSLQTENKP
jgi:biopolymer transport protein ExbD